MTAARITRDEEGLLMAEAAKARADCSRRQVGAVIMAPDGGFISSGRNGLAAGRPGCLTEGACPRGRLSYEDQPADIAYELTGCRAIHAEANAIIRAGRDRTVGATMYVTEVPCFGCSVLIEGAGIVRVVWPDGEDEVQVFTAKEQDVIQDVLTQAAVYGTSHVLVSPEGALSTDAALHVLAARRRAELAVDHPGWRTYP